jgi:hypothetical protein
VAQFASGSLKVALFIFVLTGYAVMSSWELIEVGNTPGGSHAFSWPTGKIIGRRRERILRTQPVRRRHDKQRLFTATEK